MNYSYITNRSLLEKNKICLCIDCLSEYNIDKIRDWTDNGQTVAIVGMTLLIILIVLTMF
jgi:hypothetical protein